MNVTGDDGKRLAEQFESHRTYLKAVAYRMLGSLFEVKDAKIVEIDVIADPERLRQLDLAVLDD